MVTGAMMLLERHPKDISAPKLYLLRQTFCYIYAYRDI